MFRNFFLMMVILSSFFIMGNLILAEDEKKPIYEKDLEEITDKKPLSPGNLETLKRIETTSYLVNLAIKKGRPTRFGSLVYSTANGYFYEVAVKKQGWRSFVYFEGVGLADGKGLCWMFGSGYFQIVKGEKVPITQDEFMELAYKVRNHFKSLDIDPWKMSATDFVLWYTNKEETSK